MVNLLQHLMHHMAERDVDDCLGCKSCKHADTSSVNDYNAAHTNLVKQSVLGRFH